MAPGDAPILPLEQHLDETQGSWFASVRYAHVMSNHHGLEEAGNDILFEQEGRAVGSVFSEVYDQAEPFISRRGYVPEDPQNTRSLNDLFVKDEETAKRLGLEGQYRMIEIFKNMLDERMREEAGKNTFAGEVFRQWEQKWQRQGLPAAHARWMFINAAVEKFFTADSVSAVKEFAESSDGTYGLFMNSSLNDSITLYQDNQDVIIGLNPRQGVYAFASDPRVLKSIGPNGEKVEEVMHLKDGEVVNISFSPSGEIVVRSWMRTSGKWVESTPEELAKRFYPTAEYVDGIKNPYYAPPPFQYENPRRVVQEDRQNIPKILVRAQAELDDPGSFNAQSTDYLAQRISKTIEKKGRARLVLIGYDNSYKLSKQFKKITGNLVTQSRLDIKVIDSNDFNDSPSKFNIRPDDIVMIVSKSGATFSSKLALRVVQALVDPENIFCMSARIDSVLNTVIGQGMGPKDAFTKRVFVTGEFYPSETPVVSEVLLMFQLQQLAVNLALRLGSTNFSADKLEFLSKKITEDSIRMAQELTGFDVNGKEYAHQDKEIKEVGAYLGKAALETFKTSWFMKFFVGGVLMTPTLLLSHYTGGGLLGVALDVIWITCIVPFLVTEFWRKRMGRSKYGRDAPFDLFIAAPEMIASTQRNFFSRVLTNRLKSIGPAAIYAGNPKKGFVAQYASDQKRGDINLKFSLAHKKGEGRMGVNQATYPRTAIFGTDFIKGRPEVVDVIVDVPHENDATKEEISLMDNTVGILGLMIAAKTIGVEMAKVASFDGRLFNLASTFSSAGTHTTQINPINDEVRKILDSGREKNGKNGQAVYAKTAHAGDRAMDSVAYARKPGGIDMNSRLMDLKVTEAPGSRFALNDQTMMSARIERVTPNIINIVPVTPDMLKTMLYES